jgi:Flp pilus assembly protein TadD
MIEKRLQVTVVLILCLVTAAVYARSAYFPFCLLDDWYYVITNEHVLKGLSFSSIRWAFSTFHMTNWHPLTWLSLMLDAQFFGLNPVGYHIVNVVLHIVNSALLCYLLYRTTGALWRSAFVGALFALHPLHVESVVWITERKDVLSTLFCLLTLHFYVTYVKQSKRYMYLLSFAAFAVGLMAKPMLVTIPALLLLLDYWPLGRMTSTQVSVNIMSHLRSDLKKTLPDKIPFLMLSLASSIVTLIAQKPAVASLARQPLLERLFNALWSVVMYLYQMIFPFNLAIFYPLAAIPVWRVCSAAVLLSGITVAVVKNTRRYPYLGFGWLWYLVTLLPVIGLVQVGFQSMADRYTYVPFIGLFVITSWGAADLSVACCRWRNAIIAAAAGLVLCCCAITNHQLGYWKDNITLFTHAIDITTNNNRAHEMLAFAYDKAGNPERAVTEYSEALRIRPDIVNVHHLLGDLLDQKLGRTAEALKHYEAMVRLNPQNPNGHFRMGSALQKLGKTQEAVTEYYKTLEIDPNDVICHNDLGMLFLALNRNAEAINHFSEAVRLSPTYAQAASNLQFALNRKGRNMTKQNILEKSRLPLTGRRSS